jgi:hypothetical protein
LAKNGHDKVKKIVAVINFCSKIIVVAINLVGLGGDRVLEKLLLALIMTLCLDLLVIIRLSNNPNKTTSSHIAENTTTRKKWLAPISSNWQQYQLSPFAK